MISQMEKIPLKEAIQIALNAEGQYSVAMTSSTNPYAGGIPGRAAGGGLIAGSCSSPKPTTSPRC